MSAAIKSEHGPIRQQSISGGEEKLFCHKCKNALKTNPDGAWAWCLFCDPPIAYDLITGNKNFSLSSKT